MQKYIVAVGALAFASACVDVTSVTAPAVGVPFNPPAFTLGLPGDATADTLAVGQTRQLNASLPAKKGRTRATATSWKSSDGRVATVSASGFVTAVGNGTADITAWNNLASESARILVRSVAIQPQPMPPAPSPSVTECASSKVEWIWCDDFEADRLGSYFEYDGAGGNFARSEVAGVDGSWGMRAHFSAGTVAAGSLHLAFGRTPQSYMRPVDAGATNYRELYWRVYLKNAPGWTGGGGDKLSRAMIFASPNSWAQAMIAHVWSGGEGSNYLLLDPASGTDASGTLQTTQYNDFARLRWLGYAQSAVPIFSAGNVGVWRCIEAHVRLNDAGQSNGVFELFIGGVRAIERTGLNWVGSYSEYGLNAVYVENYWNAGSPVAQDRYIDRLVVSTKPIGC